MTQRPGLRSAANRKIAGKLEPIPRAGEGDAVLRAPGVIGYHMGRRVCWVPLRLADNAKHA